MQIIKGIAIAAVLIIAGLLALIVAAYLAFRIAAAIFEQQESWKDSGSRKGRNSVTRRRLILSLSLKFPLLWHSKMTLPWGFG